MIQRLHDCLVVNIIKTHGGDLEGKTSELIHDQSGDRGFPHY